jgi:hypothetical protein
LDEVKSTLLFASSTAFVQHYYYYYEEEKGFNLIEGLLHVYKHKVKHKTFLGLMNLHPFIIKTFSERIKLPVIFNNEVYVPLSSHPFL